MTETTPITQPAIIEWLRRLQATYEAHKDELTALDSPIGDADHGTNMARGFNAVGDKLATYASKTISEILKDVGMTLVGTVGGSSGPLYGTLFLNMNTAAWDLEALELAHVAKMFAQGLEGVVGRGRAEPGEKTMVDALSPAVEALKAAAEAGQSLGEGLRAAVAAAEAGMKATVPMEARKGRASYLGERSVGHQDPGATSTYLLVKAAAETWGG
jgi:dihydroxyacetone kinase-like protein